MKTLKYLTEGMFDVDDNLNNIADEILGKEILDLIGSKDKGSVEIQGKDLILRPEDPARWIPKSTRTIEEILGWVPERIIFEPASTMYCQLFYKPGNGAILTPKNFCKTLVINHDRATYIKVVGLDGVNIEMHEDCQLLEFRTEHGVTNCTINHPHYCNIKFDSKYSKIDEVAKGTTINCKQLTDFCVSTDHSRSKKIVSDTLGDLYWSWRRNSNIYPPKVDDFTDKVPLLKVKQPTLTTPTWIGSIRVDKYPVIEMIEVNKLKKMLGVNMNAQIRGNFRLMFGAVQLNIDMARQGEVFQASYSKLYNAR